MGPLDPDKRSKTVQGTLESRLCKYINKYRFYQETGQNEQKARLSRPRSAHV